MQRSRKQLEYSTLLFIAATILLVITYVYNRNILANTAESANWVAHTYHTKEVIERLSLNVKDAERGERGYLLTSDPDFLRDYQTALQNRQNTTRELTALVQDNPVQKQNLQKTISLITQREARLKLLLEIQRKEGMSTVRAIILKGRGKALMRAIDVQIQTLLREEESLLSQRQQRLAENRLQLGFFTGLFFVLALASLIGGYIFLRKALNRVHHLLAEKNSYAQQLEQSNQELALVARIASHDLKGPLRKINFFSEQILKDPANRLSLESLDFFARLQKASDRLQTLIEYVLAIAMRKGSDFPVEPINLNILAKEVTESLEKQIDETKAQVKIDEMCTVNGNKYEIAQILQNLIENGLKYHRPGTSPTVEVSANKTDDGGCEIRVKGKGLDMERQQQADVFNPISLFQWLSRGQKQAPKPESNPELGAVHKIAQHHQGSIRIVQIPDEGSEVIVKLPQLTT